MRVLSTPGGGAWFTNFYGHEKRKKRKFSIKKRDHKSIKLRDHAQPDQETLKQEVDAWVQERNQHPRPMDWRFTTEDARIKLKRLYPSLQS